MNKETEGEVRRRDKPQPARAIIWALFAAVGPLIAYANGSGCFGWTLAAIPAGFSLLLALLHSIPETEEMYQLRRERLNKASGRKAEEEPSTKNNTPRDRGASVDVPIPAPPKNQIDGQPITRVLVTLIERTADGATTDLRAPFAQAGVSLGTAARFELIMFLVDKVQMQVLQRDDQSTVGHAVDRRVFKLITGNYPPSNAEARLDAEDSDGLPKYIGERWRTYFKVLTSFMFEDLEFEAPESLLVKFLWGSGTGKNPISMYSLENVKPHPHHEWLVEQVCGLSTGVIGEFDIYLNCLVPKDGPDPMQLGEVELQKRWRDAVERVRQKREADARELPLADSPERATSRNDSRASLDEKAPHQQGTSCRNVAEEGQILGDEDNVPVAYICDSEGLAVHPHFLRLWHLLDMSSRHMAETMAKLLINLDQGLAVRLGPASIFDIQMLLFAHATVRAMSLPGYDPEALADMTGFFCQHITGEPLSEDPKQSVGIAKLFQERWRTFGRILRRPTRGDETVYAALTRYLMLSGVHEHPRAVSDADLGKSSPAQQVVEEAIEFCDIAWGTEYRYVVESVFTEDVADVRELSEGHFHARFESGMTAGHMALQQLQRQHRPDET